MFRARKQLGKRQTAENSNGFRPKKFRTDQQVPTFQVGGREEGVEVGREGDDGTANVGRFGRRIVRGRTGNILLDCEIPRYGTPVERKHCRKAGDYVIGHELGTSPGVPQTQYLARKQGTDEFYLLKILSFDPETEVVDKEALQGKVLLHNEYTLLSMLDDLDGVIHQHGFFSDYAFEERQIESADGTMQSIYTGRIRRRLILVLDCVHAHEFCDRSADYISLQRYITVTKYTELEALQLFYEVVKVVEKLHARNIIHRDLKLNNIVLNRRTKRVVLTNFFLGKQLINERELLFDQRGSPAYISPDVLAGKPYKGKPSDIWALGVILYTIIYGKFPFLDTTPTALFRKIKEVDYVIPSGFKTSKATNTLIRSMLTLNPEERFTAIEVRLELHQMLRKMRPVKLDVDQLVPELPEPGKSTSGDHSIPSDRDSHVASPATGRSARSASAMVGEPMDVVDAVVDTPTTPVAIGSPVTTEPATPKYELSTEAFSRVLETNNQQRYELGVDGGGFPKPKQLGGTGAAGVKKPSSSIRTTPCIYPLLFPSAANGSTPSATGVLQQVSRSMSQAAGTPVAGGGGGGGVQQNRFNINLNVQYSARSYNGIGAAASGPGIGVEWNQSGTENSNTTSSEPLLERNTQTAPAQSNWVSLLSGSLSRPSSMSNINQRLPPAAQRLYAIMSYISHVRGCSTSTPSRGATERSSANTGGDAATGVVRSPGLEFNGVITQEIADKIVSFLIVNMRHHEWVVNRFRSNGTGTGGTGDPAERVNNLLELLRQLGVRMEARNGQIVIRADQTRERHQFLGIMLRLAGINDGYFVQSAQQQQPSHPQELATQHPLA